MAQPFLDENYGRGPENDPLRKGVSRLGDLASWLGQSSPRNSWTPGSPASQGPISPAADLPYTDPEDYLDPRHNGQMAALRGIGVSPNDGGVESKTAHEQATSSDTGQDHSQTTGLTQTNDYVNSLTSGLPSIRGDSASSRKAWLASHEFQPTEDPWTTNGTAGQIEGDIAAHALLNRKYGQANQEIDARQAQYPDSNALALKDAATNASLRRFRMLSEDPFAPEHEQANIAIGTKNAEYQGQRAIDVGIERDRSARFQAIESKRQEDLQHMKVDPRYRSLDPKAQAAAEAAVNETYDKMIESMKAGAAKYTGKAD